jgi:hypothetical protein
MTDLPEDWVLIEAAKRGGWGRGLTAVDLGNLYCNDNAKTYRALCDMIAKHEQKPVDRKLLCAREAITQSHNHERSYPSNICRWQWIAIRTIELWEEGYGK